MAGEPRKNPIAIFEQDGRLLEKFERSGDDWVSLADGRRMSPALMDSLGWVYMQNEEQS